MKVKLSGETNCILAQKSIPANAGPEGSEGKGEKFVFHVLIPTEEAAISFSLMAFHALPKREQLDAPDYHQ